MYQLVKSAHLILMTLWIGGMVAFALAGARATPDHALRLRELFRMSVSPAMLGTWIIGLGLTYMGGWFDVAAWPFAKMGGAFLLSGLHGVISGRLARRAVASEEPDPVLATLGPVLILILMAGTITIAVTKVF